MGFSSIVSSPRGSLTPQQALNLANVYLENARDATDTDIALVLCHDTEVSLSQARKAARHDDNQTVVEGIASAYFDLGKVLERHGYSTGAQASYKKAEKLSGDVHDLDSPRSSRHSSLAQLFGSSQSSLSVYHSPLDRPKSRKRHQENVDTLTHIFVENVRPPTVEFELPEADERLDSTVQLARCLNLLHSPPSIDEALEPGAYKWLQATVKDMDEQERLHTMATEVVRVFKRDEIKDVKAVTEVVCLAPVLSNDSFLDLLSEFYSGIDHSGLLNLHQLEGLAQLIQGANSGYLDADDLVKILDLLSKRLRDTHQQSTHHMHQLTLAVSHVLDAMADTNVTGLDRETLHEPLSTYLGELKNSSDPFLVYQAAYAYQALLCVPDNETTWQAAMRRTGKVIQGVAGLASAVKSFDLIKFMDGLNDIQKGIGGAAKVAGVIKMAYVRVTSLVEGGQDFLDGLQEGLSFERKRDWYSALRGADIMIQDGELATFRKFVCEAPCRLDPAFQWGVCQRLGEIAANQMWEMDIRRNAISFLGEIYHNDTVWGEQASVKQWILNILMQLASSSGSGIQCK
ncbi:hypothetical protein BGX34_003796 [Mortierella sp. NVP85]|nr:hypothetical protein BGX34_003796 [Mortierella sp. NVP85]